MPHTEYVDNMGGGIQIFGTPFLRVAMEKMSGDIVEVEMERNVKGGKGEASMRTSLEELRRKIPYTEVLVITSLPRGGLQIAQPQSVSESLLRAYAKEFHLEDRLSWQVIIRQKALRLSDAWNGQNPDSIRYLAEFLKPAGLRYGVAAPLASPVIEGYPGALHLYRSAELGEFTDAELHTLARFVGELDASYLQVRDSRPTPKCNNVLRHESVSRQFVLNQKLQPQLWPQSFGKLDSRIREGMIADARQRLAHVNGKATVSDRVPFADSRGDLWNYRVTVHRRYPALGEGPFVFFCQQPETKQWSKLRSVDFQADAELARLVPALKFMQEHFSKGPTLVNISKTVHLSPFHFHRRFTELLGITPKHFLLDCQIEEAKRMLVSREKGLAAIATACGFAHQSHFTSRFKQATGLTPTRWRRLAVESQQASAN
jgi:AraC-like DNA-binding protein